MLRVKTYVCIYGTPNSWRLMIKPASELINVQKVS